MKSLKGNYGEASDVLDEVFLEFKKPDNTCFWGTYRAPRMLLIAISALTFEDLKKVAPESMKLKRYQKIPLVILLTMTAFSVGLNQVQLKIIGLFAIDNAAWELETILLFIYTALQAFIVVLFMNLAMAHYPQLDVIPIYESLVIALTIGAGMIFF